MLAQDVVARELTRKNKRTKDGQEVDAISSGKNYLNVLHANRKVWDV